MNRCEEIVSADALCQRDTDESEDAYDVWVLVRWADMASHARGDAACACSYGGFRLGTCALAEQETDAPGATRLLPYGQ